MGDSIDGYVISAIEEKRVVLDYYGEKLTLNLHEAKESAKEDIIPLDEAKPEQTKSEKQKPPLKEESSAIQDMQKSSAIPEALPKSPVMPSEDTEIVEFSQKILDKMKERESDLDQETIKEMKEKLREQFMEKLEGTK